MKKQTRRYLLVSAIVVSFALIISGTTAWQMSSIREIVAENENTPVWMLKILVTDKELYVKSAAMVTIFFWAHYSNKERIADLHEYFIKNNYCSRKSELSRNIGLAILGNGHTPSKIHTETYKILTNC